MRICSILLLAVAIIAPSVGSQKTKLSVCSISAHPARFAGKIVVLSSQLNSDGIERENLTDKDCDDVGIAILAPNHFKGEAEFVKALQTGHPGTLDKTISGTFVGKFIWRPHDIPKWSLILREVRNITTVMNAKS